MSFKALRREDRGLPEIVSKWSFGQFRSAFLSFTVNTTMIHRYYSWELWGKRIIQQPFYTNTSLSFWGFYIYIYIYYDNLYSILQKFQKQTEFVPVLFRPRNPMFAIHDIRALPQSSPRSGPKIHSTLCLFNVAIENQYL